MPITLPRRGTLWLGLMALSTLASSAPSAGKSDPFSDWATIHNRRFGFSIAYPFKVLFPAPTPSGQDGRILQSKDGRAKLLVATFENAENLTLDAYRDFLLSDVYAGTKLDYAPQKGRWFVLSGVRGDETFYERVTFSCGGKLINSWAMLYPTAERRFYDRVLEAISRTYTAGSGADGQCGDASPYDGVNEPLDREPPRNKRR